jgi:hypothetical protein
MDAGKEIKELAGPGILIFALQHVPPGIDGDSSKLLVTLIAVIGLRLALLLAQVSKSFWIVWLLACTASIVWHSSLRTRFIDQATVENKDQKASSVQSFKRVDSLDYINAFESMKKFPAAERAKRAEKVVLESGKARYDRAKESEQFLLLLSSFGLSVFLGVVSLSSLGSSLEKQGIPSEQGASEDTNDSAKS